jgi:hypothetical protein
MRIDYQHNLTQEEAYRRINALLTDLPKPYADKISNLKTSWNPSHTLMDYSVEIMGFSTQGELTLKNGQISLEGKLPFAARLFRGEIEKMVKTQLDDLLA